MTIQLPLSDKELREGNPPTIWDNTMRIQLIECPRKLYYFLRGYDYKEKPVYFTFGSAWHEILNTWYSFSDDLSQEARMEDPKVFKKASQLALNEGLDFWDKEAPMGFGDNTRNNLINLWSRYLSLYPIEQWHLLPGGGETGWIWPMPSPPFTLEENYSLGGSLDGRIEWPGYGTMILENKTEGGWLSDGYLDSYYFSPQITGYIWYADQLSGRKDNFGALVNMASKKTAKAGKTPKFARSIQKRTEKDLDEFIRAFQFDLLRFEFFWKSWTWPKSANPQNCCGGKGKSTCLFKPLCKTQQPLDELDPLSFPGISFRDQPWEPWKREGEQL